MCTQYINFVELKPDYNKILYHILKSILLIDFDEPTANIFRKPYLLTHLLERIWYIVAH